MSHERARELANTLKRTEQRKTRAFWRSYWRARLEAPTPLLREFAREALKNMGERFPGEDDEIPF